ncbi:MAG: hypothetical protein K0R18_507 [Bacillales bacterium]|jgi:hypothetical protein|nr:hypothetical protein [Bacillales bacterium]
MVKVFNLFIHKCPICDGKITCNDPSRFVDFSYCENRCFTVDEVFIHFFDEDKVCFNMFRDEAKIMDEIKYWKQDERYLTKMMGV